MKRFFKSGAAAALGLFFGAVALPQASADPITFTGSGTAFEGSTVYTGETLSASATFDTVTAGGNTYLTVLLTNTSATPALRPSSILTGVFFNIAGANPTLTRTSATVAPGSETWANVDGTWQVFTTSNTSYNTSDNVGGEWAYKASPFGAGASEYGISSTGLDDIFGPGDRFDTGQNLAGPTSPNGLQFGLAPTSNFTVGGAVPSNLSGTTLTPLVANSLLFRLQLPSSGFDPSAAITDVRFQYGTSRDQSNFGGTPPPPPPPGVPLPGVVWGGLALLGGTFASRRVACRRAN